MSETTASTVLTNESPGFFKMVWGVLARPRATLATLRSSQNRAWILMAILGMVVVTCQLLPAAQSPPSKPANK
ncbi:MAG: hypothetical protein IPJ90_11295 [Anaerolineaceae bacterium]|nr:hypothetical protein [Anaerolineaceae bacterium]